MINDKQILLDTNGEGPCAKSLGLYKLLDTLCKKYNFEKTKISLTTCNLKESHDKYIVKIVPQTWYLEQCKTLLQNQVSAKKFSSIKHFGHFIGHGNLHRLHIASFLYNNIPSTLQTYHTTLTDSYHAPFIGIDEMMYNQYSWNEITDALHLLKHSPLTLDQIDQYPILCPETYNIAKIYPEFFIEIVSCTYFTGNTFYIDEKIWRPIAMKTPFIVQGSQNFINNLKKLGFQTFSKYWDEGYSEDPSEYQPLAIIEILKKLQQKTLVEIEEMYSDMQETLDHNFLVLQNLKESDFSQFVNLWH